MSPTDLRIRVVPAIRGIAAAECDACANPTVPGNPSGCPESISQVSAYNPFISHAFLHALEVSRSATARTGWQPQHLLAETASGSLLGVVPCYLKMHSRGEYVFDQGWADAYGRAGGHYYP